MAETICIVGNSVSLLVWPRRNKTDDLTYAEHLETMGWIIKSASRQGVMISDTCFYLEDDVLNNRPDYLILQFGIVEATYRARPRFLHRQFSNNNWRNSVVRIPYRGPQKRSLISLLNKAYRQAEKLFFALGIKWRYLSPRLFQDALEQTISTCKRHCGAKGYILIGILPVNERLEEIAPGTRQSTSEFNEIMRAFAENTSHVRFVNPSEIFQQESLNELIPDSIHLSALGHELLAQKLNAILLGLGSSSSRRFEDDLTTVA